MEVDGEVHRRGAPGHQSDGRPVVGAEVKGLLQQIVGSKSTAAWGSGCADRGSARLQWPSAGAQPFAELGRGGAVEGRPCRDSSDGSGGR